MTRCSHTLMTGPRRGMACGRSICSSSDTYCSTHHKMHRQASPGREAFLVRRQRSARADLEFQQRPRPSEEGEARHMAPPLEVARAPARAVEAPPLAPRPRHRRVRVRFPGIGAVEPPIMNIVDIVRETKQIFKEDLRREILREFELSILTEKYESSRRAITGKDKKTTSPDLVCAICSDNEKCILFQPCGHLTCCASCSKTLWDRKETICPICRSVPTELCRVYLN